MYTISNAYLTVRVAAVGAELCGLYAKTTQTEYMWQPGHETWDHSSLLLFPNPGRIAHDRTVIGGKVYPAMMHGFAGKMPFAVTEHTETRLTLELTANEYTRQYYPYAFRLVVEYILEGERLVQNIRVVNEDEKPVYYALGAHPAFYCPIRLNEPAENYRLTFDRPQNIRNMQMQENTRLVTGETTPWLTGSDTVALGDGFFNNGPMLLEGVDAATITLHSPVSGRFVEMGIEGFPNLCLWGAPTKMYLIAIEPWTGPSDRVDTNHVWEEKPGVQAVPVGQTNTHTLTYRVG